MRAQEKSITLVLGGARSGKSSYAQELALRFKHVTFIATALPIDSEMQRKIDAHRSERPASWKTIEAPIELAEAIRSESKSGAALLVDCLTVHVGNLMHEKQQFDYGDHFRELCAEIEAAQSPVIAVSNEVGSGIVPTFPSGRQFRDLLGQLNRQVAVAADTVVLMVAGIPMTIKDRG